MADNVERPEGVPPHVIVDPQGVTDYLVPINPVSKLMILEDISEEEALKRLDLSEKPLDTPRL